MTDVDPLGWCAQGEAVRYISRPAFTARPTSPLCSGMMHLSEDIHSHLCAGCTLKWCFRVTLRLIYTSNKLRDRNVSALPAEPSSACQLSPKASTVDRNLPGNSCSKLRCQNSLTVNNTVCKSYRLHWCRDSGFTA